MTRRPILTALVAVAATLTGLAFYAYLIATGREEQRDADDLEVLHALVDGRPIDLPMRRAQEARWRLAYIRAIVFDEATDAYYLTRVGWARIGRPLSASEFDAIRLCCLSYVGGWGKRREVFLDRHRVTFDSVARHLETRGLVDNEWGTTPAGRAVLSEVPS